MTYKFPQHNVKTLYLCPGLWPLNLNLCSCHLACCYSWIPGPLDQVLQSDSMKVHRGSESLWSIWHAHIKQADQSNRWPLLFPKNEVVDFKARIWFLTYPLCSVNKTGRNFQPEDRNVYCDDLWPQLSQTPWSIYHFSWVLSQTKKESFKDNQLKMRTFDLGCGQLGCITLVTSASKSYIWVQITAPSFQCGVRIFLPCFSVFSGHSGFLELKTNKPWISWVEKKACVCNSSHSTECRNLDLLGEMTRTDLPQK